MMNKLRPDPSSPAAQIRTMIEAKGWSQTDTAYILGISPAIVNQLVTGKYSISPKMAKLLSAAFGEPPEYFMALQARWSLLAAAEPDLDVRARAYAHARFPIREMAKRGWISGSTAPDGVHAELCKFFGVNSLESIATLRCSARKTGDGDLNGEQMAWLYRVRSIAKEMAVSSFSNLALEEAAKRMLLMRENPEEIRHVARVLQEAGVRFVVVEGLPGGKIDGVCTWLNDRSPVIAMSLRFDRIDNFWFVLRHEMSHVLHGHGKGNPKIDSDINSESQDVDAEEKIANRDASDFCVPHEKMKSFYLRKQPFFADSDVRAFSKINHIHPGIVVGQLQNMSGQFNLLRHHLVSVRKFVAASAMTDGFGQMISVT